MAGNWLIDDSHGGRSAHLLISLCSSRLQIFGLTYDMILRSSRSHSLFDPYHHNHHQRQHQQQQLQQQTQQTQAQYHPSRTPPSMPSSRPLRNKYSSQALTSSPLRRKSFVPPDSDLDEDSDLDHCSMQPDDIFG